MATKKDNLTVRLITDCDDESTDEELLGTSDNMVCESIYLLLDDIRYRLLCQQSV